MPISNKMLVQSTLALLGVGLLALLGIVGAVIYLGQQSQVYFDDVLQAIEARAAAVDVRDVLRTAETNQRGYLITGDAGYLEDYEEAKAKVLPRFAELEQELAEYPQAIEPLARTRETLNQKIEEMDSTIATFDSGGRDQATAIVATGRGSNLAAEALQFFDAVITAADTRLREGVAQQVSTANWLRWVSILGGLLIIAVVGGSALTVWRYTREINAARERVAGLNTELEERVDLRTADLARANEEIQRFAYIVTHDLRAPLVNIMGFTAELEESIKPIQALVSAEEQDPDMVEAGRLAANEDLPEAIGFIRSSTNKMDALINAILKLSREGRRTLKAERVDLVNTIETALAAVHHQVSEADGSTEMEVGVTGITSDRLSVEQVIGNLIDNAVKYRAKDRPLRLSVTVSEAPGNYVLIAVGDNGRGIAPEDAERVFEPFRRSGVQDQAGEGIGLAYVRTIVRNLGGEITMNSVLGEGTTFQVVLPRTLQTLRRTA